MENWPDTPLILVAFLAVGSVLVSIGVWVGSVNADRKSFKEFMNEVRNDIKKILARLPAPTIESGSPIRLTDLGRSVADDLDVGKWVEQVAPSLTARVKGKPPFEVQNFCFDYVKDEFEPDEKQLRKLQMCADENGIDLDAVLDVLAVELRDRLLELSPTSATGSGEAA